MRAARAERTARAPLTRVRVLARGGPRDAQLPTSRAVPDSDRRFDSSGRAPSWPAPQVRGGADEHAPARRHRLASVVVVAADADGSTPAGREGIRKVAMTPTTKNPAARKAPKATASVIA